METIETNSKTKRFGQVAIDIALFAALAFIILTIIGIPLWAMWESPGNGGANEIFYLIPLEALTLISVFLSAWVVWRFRKVSLAVWGRSLALRRKDVLAGILLAVVLYAVGFGISLLAER